MAKAEIKQAAVDLGLTIRSVFVPWSQSRAKDEKLRSLNWKVTLLRQGREVLTCDYMAGQANCPAYHAFKQGTVIHKEAVAWECEHGRTYRENSTWHGLPILPDLADVLYSLTLDSGVLDYASFEEWALDHGYDPDSRKAEAIYRACLETALKLRASLGERGLTQLREATQDY